MIFLNLEELRVLIHERRSEYSGDILRAAAIQFEDCLHHTDFSRSCVKATERSPVIHHHSCSKNVTTTVYGTCNKRYLLCNKDFYFFAYKDIL
jgi:hypothetical protein